MELLLLSLLGVAALGLAFGGSDDDSDADPDPDPEDNADLGATVSETGEGVRIDLGEDETGSLVAIKFEEFRQDNTGGGDGVLVTEYSLGVYLLPEGASFPVDPTGDAFGDQTAEEYLDSIDARLVTEFDLGATTSGAPGGDTDTRVEPPGIETADPLPIIRLQTGDGILGGSETDETLSPFEPGGIFFDGVELQELTGSFGGTPDVDFVRTTGGAAGVPVLVEGLGGGDNLSVTQGLSTILGGSGDDVLTNAPEGGLIRGGAGDDVLSIQGPGSAFGSEGNDTLSAIGDVGPLTVSGGDGDDVISVFGPDAFVEGDEGDDILALSAGAVGLGGSGNDLVQVENGSSGNGGSGNDTLRSFDFFAEASPDTLMRGGADADLFEITSRNPVAGETAQIIRIADFNPEEDMLQVGLGQTNGVRVEGVRIQLAADSSHTDVLVDFTGGYLDGATSTAVIRLDGAVAITADQVVVV